MASFAIYDPSKKPDADTAEQLVDFLHRQLGEFGDSKADIARCLDFAMGNLKRDTSGSAVVYKEADKILGATIVNETGMSGYIPENILLYIAVHKDARGKGIGKIVMDKAAEIAEGDIALHVEADNPALHLYKKLGYTNDYLEMRLKNWTFDLVLKIDPCQ